MPEPRPWTDADRELVGDTLHDYLTGLGLPPEMVRPFGAAAAVLDALTAAGWRREVDVRAEIGDEITNWVDGLDEPVPDEAHAGYQAAEIARGNIQKPEPADA